jgi:hypothetical protein
MPYNWQVGITVRTYRGTGTVRKKNTPLGLATITNTREQKILKTATQELKQLLNNNKIECIEKFLQGLTSTESTDYSCGRRPK